MEKIAMLGTFPEDGLERMKTACQNRYELICCTRREMLAEVKGADYAVLRGIPIGAAEMDLLGPQVKLYHRWGVGYDTVDVEEAGEKRDSCGDFHGGQFAGGCRTCSAADACLHPQAVCLGGAGPPGQRLEGGHYR